MKTLDEVRSSLRQFCGNCADCVVVVRQRYDKLHVAAAAEALATEPAPEVR